MRETFLRILCFPSVVGFGQHWTKLDEGINYAFFPNTFIYSDDKELIYHGFFNCDGNGDSLHGIAKWNGFNFETIAGGIRNGGPYCSGIARYKDKLYASGYFNPFKPVSVASYNSENDSWDSVDVGLMTEGTLSLLDDKLILHGWIEYCAGQHCSGICAFDGESWDPLLSLSDDNFAFHNVKCIVRYKDNVYIAGNFYLPDANNQMIDDLAILENNQIRSFGGGFHNGGMDGVDKMVIYKDELYMIGGFNPAVGDADNKIVRWDGEKFKPVGGGADAFIGDLIVNNDLLIAVGAFTNIGGIYSPMIACWDGNQWHPMPGGESIDFPASHWICEGTIYKNELYIAGLFGTIDGIQYRNVAKYNHVLPGSENNFNIYAVAETDELVINFEDPGKYSLHINVISVNGQVVESKLINGLQGYSHQQISIANWANGVYIVTAMAAGKSITKKIVKAN
jgi:hypothetical protein